MTILTLATVALLLPTTWVGSASVVAGSFEEILPAGDFVVLDIAIRNEGPFEFGFAYEPNTTTHLPYLPVFFAFLIPGGEGYLGGAAFAYHPEGAGAGAHVTVESSTLGDHVMLDETIVGGIGIGYGWFPPGEYRGVIATAPAEGNVRVWVRPADDSVVATIDAGRAIFVRGFDASPLRAFAEVDKDQGLVAWHHGDADVAIDVRNGFVGFLGNGLPRADAVVAPSGASHPDFDFVIAPESGTFRAQFPARTQVGPECQDLSGRFCYLMYPNALLGVDTENWGVRPPDPRER